MKRFVLAACVVVTLMSVTGCAKWKQKHYYRSAYEGDACGCGAAPVYETAAPSPCLRQRARSYPHLGKCCPRPSFDDTLSWTRLLPNFRFQDSRFHRVFQPDGIWNSSKLRRRHGESFVGGDLSLVRSGVSQRRMLVGQPEGTNEARDCKQSHLKIDVTERDAEVRLHDRELCRREGLVGFGSERGDHVNAGRAGQSEPVCQSPAQGRAQQADADRSANCGAEK